MTHMQATMDTDTDSCHDAHTGNDRERQTDIYRQTVTYSDNNTETEIDTHNRDRG